MRPLTKTLAVIAVSAAGLWGCAQGPVGGSVHERVKALEARNTRLEEDYKTVAAARDQVRKQLAAAEAEQARLARQVARIQELERDRDALQAQVKARTGERDAVASQFDDFRKSLRDLIGKTETSSAKQPDGSTATGPAVTPGRS